jgi:hypothetical protein
VLTRHVEGPHFAIPRLLHPELHGLARHEESEALPLDLRLVHKHVRPAGVGLDKPEALVCVWE